MTWTVKGLREGLQARKKCRYLWKINKISRIQRLNQSESRTLMKSRKEVRRRLISIPRTCSNKMLTKKKLKTSPRWSTTRLLIYAPRKLSKNRRIPLLLAKLVPITASLSIIIALYLREKYIVAWMDNLLSRWANPKLLQVLWLDRKSTIRIQQTLLQVHQWKEVIEQEPLPKWALLQNLQILNQINQMKKMKRSKNFNPHRKSI